MIEKIEKLADWVQSHNCSKDMMWKDGFYAQVNLAHHIENLLNRGERVLAESFSEDNPYPHHFNVVGTHVSKSITLPIYNINFYGVDVTWTYNFHEYEIYVNSAYDLNINFEDLIKDEANKSLAYFNNKRKFEFTLHSSYDLHTFFYKLWHHIRLKEEQNYPTTKMIQDVLDALPFEWKNKKLIYDTLEGELTKEIENFSKSRNGVKHSNMFFTVYLSNSRVKEFDIKLYKKLQEIVRKSAFKGV